MSDRFLDLPNWRPADRRTRARPRGRTGGARARSAETRREIEERVAAFNRDWRELDRLIAAQILARRVLPRRGGRDQLPALLQHQRSGRPPDGARAGVRARARPGLRDARSGRDRRAPDRSYRRAVRSRRPISSALREHAERPFYLVVEKILAPHERLRADWPVEGTTGYDYLNLVARSPDRFVGGRRRSTTTYRAFAGVDADASRRSPSRASSGSWTTRWRASSARLAAPRRALPGKAR